MTKASSQSVRKPKGPTYAHSFTKDLNNFHLAQSLAKVPDDPTVTPTVFVLDCNGLRTCWEIAKETASSKRKVSIVIANLRSEKQCLVMRRQIKLLHDKYPSVKVILRTNTTANQAMMDLSREGTVLSAVYLDFCGTYAKYGAPGFNILATMDLLPKQRCARVICTFDKRNERAISYRPDSSSPGADTLREQLLHLQSQGYIDVDWQKSNMNYSYASGWSNMWCANIFMRRGTASPIRIASESSAAPIHITPESSEYNVVYKQVYHTDDGSKYDIRLVGAFNHGMLWRGFRDEVRVGDNKVARRLVFDGTVSDVVFDIVEHDTAEFDVIMKTRLNDSDEVTVEDLYHQCEVCFLYALPRLTTNDQMLTWLRHLNPHASLDLFLHEDFEGNKGPKRHAKVTAIYTQTQARCGHQRLSKYLDFEESVGFKFHGTDQMEELTLQQYICMCT